MIAEKRKLFFSFLHAFASAGNLLVLKDGRLGFIDFGIVGKISPITFQAMEAFLMSSMTADYNTMARALITMGVTQEQVVIEVKPFTSLHSFLFAYPPPFFPHVACHAAINSMADAYARHSP
jgi:hypothetical protein